MKRLIKVITVFLLIVISAVSFVGCDFQFSGGGTGGGSVVDGDQAAYSIRLRKLYNGKATQTLNSNVRNYVNKYDDLNYLAEAMYKRNQQKIAGNFESYDYQGVKIEWEDTGANDSYTVYVADNEQFDNAFTYTTEKTSVSSEIGIFVPNETYYYKIVGSDDGEESMVDSFIAKAQVRYISADKVKNVRDLGGWQTTDGKIIKYGLLYRGAALNEGPSHSYLSDEAKHVFDYLGIKGEIDLRGEDKGDSASENNQEEWLLNKINSEYPILREGLVYFAYEQMTTNLGKAENNLPKIFEFLGNEDNYPIYFHCSVGADRTGTLAYIIGALLGVDYEHLMVDFELTSFTDLNLTGGVRQRASINVNDGVYSFNEPSNDISFPLGYAHKLLMEKYSSYSTNLQQVMEKYLIDVGVDKDDIDNFKEIMLKSK